MGANQLNVQDAEKGASMKVRKVLVVLVVSVMAIAFSVHASPQVHASPKVIRSPATTCYWHTVGLYDQSKGSYHLHVQLQALFYSSGSYCGRVIANAYQDVPSGYLGGGLVVAKLFINNADTMNAYCTIPYACDRVLSPTKYEAGGSGYSVGDTNHGDRVYAAGYFSDNAQSVYLSGDTNTFQTP